jgi:hypothetical protein
MHTIPGDVVKPWITEPNVYPDVTDEQYHADPVVGGSVSSTALKLMLPPSCPAKAREYLDNGRPPKRHFDIGLAAHALVLGEGRELAVWEGESQSWQSNDAKAFRDKSRAAGRIPLLRAEAGHVKGMRDAVLRHPIAGPLFDPGSFSAEVTVVWRDEPTRIMCRAKYDAVPHYPPGGRMSIVDYKTAENADAYSVSAAIYRYGYAISAAHYRNGAITLGLGGDDTEFFLVYQEKTPPYVLHVGRIIGPALRRGEAKARRALELFAECQETGRWPGYTDDRIADLDEPGWAVREFERDAEADLYTISGDFS